MSAMTATRPSDARRQQLKAAESDVAGNNGVPLVSNFFPIDRYYNASDKLYDAFSKAFEERRLDDAYVYGLRFAAFSVEGLPKHDYYKSKKYEANRRRNTLLVKEVLSKVEAVVEFMDEEELAKQREVRRRHEEALKREEDKERQRYDALQERILKLKSSRPRSETVNGSTSSSSNVESSALSKLELLRQAGQQQQHHQQPKLSSSSSHGSDNGRKDRRGSAESARSSSRDDGRLSSSRHGEHSSDEPGRRRTGSGDDLASRDSPRNQHSSVQHATSFDEGDETSKDSRRNRRSLVHNNGSIDEGDDRRHNGHRRSSMNSPTPPEEGRSRGSSRRLTMNNHHSSGVSSDDDMSSGGRRQIRPPPSSSSSSPPFNSGSNHHHHSRNNGSERSNTHRSSGSHASGNSLRRTRSKSPSILIDQDQQPPAPSNNSWSQAPDPKDAWKLEKDDDEPVSSRFRENLPVNRRGSTTTTSSSATNGGVLPKSNTLPPPLLPPAPPPSYNQVVSTLKPESVPVNSRFRANQYFGPSNGNFVPDFTMSNSVNRPFAAPAGGARRVHPIEPSSVVVPPPLSSSASRTNGFHDASSGALVTPTQPPVRPIKPAERIPIRKLRDNYANDYRRAQQDGFIEIRPIDTHQGRLRQSTNGCTVISPLVVAHHLRNSAGGVLDSEIVDVIDKECGPLLREIRSKLGLEGDSLIIPSDVHDHLVDRKILQQNKFYGATGGNILDREHIWEFLKLLQAEDKGAFNKAGACLFFHEHVVSLVKVPIGRGKVVYDLVDSMPSSSHGSRATRTRCRDLNALDVLLRWYTTRKFSESECTYIDRNEWDENMADFDPRVFQSFVWTE